MNINVSFFVCFGGYCWDFGIEHFLPLVIVSIYTNALNSSIHLPNLNHCGLIVVKSPLQFHFLVYIRKGRKIFFLGN